MFEVLEKGKGYGRKIIEELLNNQLPGCTVYLIPNNKESATFWEKLKFKPIEGTQTVFVYKPDDLQSQGMR
ncbi:hypothetical protein [Brevibacillus reuszeri]|uniref:hypothetical protein n=1 Tax=Brevibacillus reuszeri TaxID=54915 RepID=UPI000CCC7954|nr:hypothetical protein [Brevibacillus reuszeri]